jgi:methylthioribose-1-phosphate isomerase
MPADTGRRRPIWLGADGRSVKIIDQRKLPHALEIVVLKTADDAIRAIQEMYVRGAPLIGVTGAYGLFLAVLEIGDAAVDDPLLEAAAERIKASRPTAVNLAWAVETVWAALRETADRQARIATARQAASAIAEQEAEHCRCIGLNGLPLIEDIRRRKSGATVNILTHCNAGWLACVEYGTATAPIYAAHDRGMDVHVWVDETRPLNQGARLTAWELGEYGIPHTLVPDNAGGHLMQHGLVDMVLVGTDRTTYTGDVANKVGTYLKALAARDNRVPFYVALPSSTFDWSIRDGLKIPIEERDPDEVRFVEGLGERGSTKVRICPEKSRAANFAFDVTPARLVSGFITERGVCRATEEDIRRLFPEKAPP